MSARFIDLLLRLAPRERLLLGVLAVVLLVAGVGFGVIQPLAEQRRTAQNELLQAIALDAWVLGRRDDLNRIDRPAGTRATEPVGASAIEQGLIALNLRNSLSRLETGEDGGITMRFDAVPFGRFMIWLDSEEDKWGYRIQQLRIERTDRPAMVEARLTLEPAD
ncbi:type II secretion system protein GspM [Roseovarius aestuariivivens]|uniref:type II secretion system protein GspM n=1 Tax=Roseovarius aestuariivivens TaxID=1888910 RepID=UPI00108215C7|nr:type II secretion system protein GspM [Roseovarius aestuariivivens]